MFYQNFFDTRERLAIAVADEIARCISTALAARGEATLVVSGGSSPIATLQALAARDIDWSRVTVVPSDERWVDESDPASNAGMLRKTLFREHAAQARLVGLYDPAVALADAAGAISERIDALPRPFDYVLLGMGEDGHTASLFPDAPNIKAALASRASCVVAEPPSQPLARISLTPRALLDARAIGLLFFGQKKADVFAAASAGGELDEYPVRCILRQEIVPVTTFFSM